MPVGTVRGRFELDAPALQTLKDLEKQGIKTEAAMKSLGEEMDRVGGQRDVAQLREYEKAEKDLGSTSERVHLQLRKDWIETTRIVKRETQTQRDSIDLLIIKMEELDTVTASPNVNVDGIVQARAELASLKRELNQIDRTNATATVGARPSAVAAATPGGGGGGGSSGFGGGGGGRNRRGPIDFGMSGIRPRSALMGLGAVYARPLVGGAAALGGSAGAAALGAGALAATGYGAALGGGLLTYATAKPMMAQLQAVQLAEKQYTQQVALHGAASKEAASAQAKLNFALSQAPQHAAAFMKTLTDFRNEWAKVSRPAQTNLFGAGTGFIQGLRPGLPAFGGAAAVATGAIKRSATDLGAFLGGSHGQQFASTSSGIFADNLPYVRRDLEAIFTMWTNLMRASRPFFLDMNQSVTHFLEGSAKGSNNIKGMRGDIRTLVQDFKDWVKFADELWKLIRDIEGVGGGAQAGTSLVKDMTNQLKVWDDWVNRNPVKVRQFFTDSIQSVKDLAGAIRTVARDLNGLLKNLQPTIDGLSGLISLMGGGGGILTSPSALIAGYGALRGARGGGIFGRGGGVAVAGGGAVAAPAAALAGPAALYAGGMGLRGARNAQMLAGGRIFTAETQAFNRYGTNASGRVGQAFAYGAPVSQIGRRRFLGSAIAGRVTTGLGRIAPRIGAAGGAALEAYLPFAALMGVGQAAQPGLLGGGMGRVQAFFAGVDPTGLLPHPMTRAEAAQTGNTNADAWLSAHPNASVPGLRGALSSLLTTPNKPAGIFGQGLFGVMNRPGKAAGDLQTLEARAKGGDQVAAQRLAEYKALNQVLKQQIALQKQADNTAQDQKAAKNIQDMGKAFDTLEKHLGSRKAAQGWTKDFRDAFSRLKPEGQRALAQGSAEWVAQMQKAGKLTTAQARKMNDDIAAQLQGVVGSFESTGKRIEVINGRIYDGSSKQWNKIQGAIGGYAEQALERTQTAFTKLQWYAIHSLQSMGYTMGQAKSIVAGNEKGGLQATPNSMVTQRTGSGQLSLQSQSNRNAQGANVRAPKKERGGRAVAPNNPYDLTDRLQIGGDMVGPGELWVNRHTEARVNKLLAEKNTTLGREVAFEGRPHSKPGFARGGRRVGSGLMSGVNAVAGAASGAPTSQGTIGGAHPAVSAMVRMIMAANPGLSVTSTTSGGHAGGSYHYRGEAIDIAGASGTMRSAADWIKRVGAYKQMVEGIHNPNLSVKNGAFVSPSFWGGSTWAGHANHIHVAVLDNANVGSFGTGGGVPGTQSIRIPAPRSGMRGVPGALADSAGKSMALGMQSKVNARLAAMGGGGGGISGSGFTGGGSAQANQKLGQQMMLAAGWGMNQWPSLLKLWNQESGWLPKTNPSSGAYGIPQALGHGHPFGINDIPAQIAWGLNYIKGRYGSPSNAWAHEVSHNWYERGGRRSSSPFGRDRHTFAGFMRQGGAFETIPGRAAHFVAGEGGVKEEVHVRPVRTPRIPALKGLSGASALSGGVNVYFHGPVHVGSQDQMDELVKKVGDEVGKQLLTHLSDDKTADLELIDG